MVESRHVAALDGMRGIAVAAVVGYHLRPEWVPGGFLGVDLFFVLSGYLITSLLFDERTRSGSIDLLAFAGRRLRRLLPAVLLVVIAVVVHESIRGDFGQIEQARRHAFGTLAYVANWVFISDGDSYFADFAGPSMFRHMWSLAIEEQFYLLWPVTVLAVIGIGGRRAVGYAALGLGLLSIGWMAVQFDGGDPSRAYFGTDTRIFEPLIGAFGAVLWPLRGEKPAWVARAGTLAGAGWLVALFVVDDQWGGFYQGGAVLLGVMALIAVVGATASGPLARVAETTPLVWLGAISYGVYLWHWPILLMLRRGGWSGIGLDAAVIVLTLLVSTASYRLVERPIRRAGGFGGSLIRRLRPIGLATAAVVAVAVVVAVTTRNTVPADATTVNEVISSLPSQSEGADGFPDAATVVLIGDSSAWTVGGGWVTPGADHGPYSSPFDPEKITLVNLGRKGYRLVLNDADELDDQPDWLSDNLEHEALWIETVADVQPDLIVAMFGLSDVQNSEIDESGQGFISPEPDTLRASAGAVLLDTLSDVAPVVVLSAPRLVTADMPDPDAAAFFEAASHALTANFNMLLADVSAADPGLQFLDYGDWLCPADASDPLLRDGCRATADGEAVRYDGTHYSEAGAAVAAEWLTSPILSAAEGA